jgi:hypothetical protein
MRAITAAAICIFWTCWGPLPDAGSASDYMNAQKVEVMRQAYVIPDGNGFDVFMLLTGPQPQGKICTAVSNGLPAQPDVSLCAGSTTGLERFGNTLIVHDRH